MSASGCFSTLLSRGSQTSRDTTVRRALLIGLQYDKRLGQLSGCWNDVRGVAQVLKKEYGYGEVTMMTDEPSNRNSSAWPNRKNVKKAIKQLIKGTKSGDRLYFHYSGHGTQEQKKVSTKKESDGHNEAIVEADKGDLIIDDDLYDWLIDALPEGVRLVAIMDCCNSGTNLDLPFTWRPKNSSSNDIELEGDNVSDARKKWAVEISGCLDDQLSHEVSAQNGKTYGAMTDQWIIFLKWWIQAQSQISYTWQDVVDFIFKGLKVTQIDQIPQLSATTRAPISEFFSL